MTMKAPFWRRKLRQIGKTFGYQLIDANDPSDVFKELLSYRALFGGTLSDGSGKQFLADVIQNLHQSKAQICQDLLALHLTHFKRGGFFVEFGATDGVSLSNTYLLEKSYGWTGVLAEPALRWQESLKKNRSCLIDNRCVWSKSGEMLNFHEADIGELSTLGGFTDGDGHTKDRAKGRDYVVESVSLNDLLASHDAPRVIDYLSVDTEGSEYEVLSHFDFSKYHVQLITVEHNHSTTREKINKLLVQNGFTQVFAGFSQWDDWYTKRACGTNSV